MSALTKELLERLPPEQQADLAKLEAQKAARRERLLKQVRGSEVLLLLQGGGLAVALGAACYAKAPWPILLCLGATAAVIVSGIVSVNRRINALLGLYETEKSDDSA